MMQSKTDNKEAMKCEIFPLLDAINTAKALVFPSGAKGVFSCHGNMLS